MSRKSSPPRKITDATTLRALTHPVRIALIESLSVEGPATATEVGDRIGESPTTCSFHLRQLAKYGFVEEAGGGKGRSRPWKVTSIGMTFAAGDDDPVAQIAATSLLRLVRERQFARYAEWQQHKATYPKKWRDAATDSEFVIYLTPAELRGVSDELRDVLMDRYRERLENPHSRPPGSAPVEFLVMSYPIRPADQ